MLPLTPGIVERIESMPNAMTVRDLAEILNVSKMTIYRMVDSGVIPAFLGILF